MPSNRVKRRCSSASSWTCLLLWMTDSGHPVPSRGRAALAPYKTCEIREGRSPMALLDHSEAPTLLDDATITPHSVRACVHRLTGSLQLYLPRFYRVDQQVNAMLVI